MSSRTHALFSELEKISLEGNDRVLNRKFPLFLILCVVFFFLSSSASNAA